MTVPGPPPVMMKTLSNSLNASIPRNSSTSAMIGRSSGA